MIISRILLAISIFGCGVLYAGENFPFPFLIDAAKTAKPEEPKELVLYKGVDVTSVNDAVRKIHQANKTGSGDLLMYIDSAGGDPEQGVKLIDAIHASKRPITGVCINECASMAGIIFMACPHRVMLPHSRLLFHDGQFSISNSQIKAKSRIELWNKLNNDFVTQVTELTHFSPDKISALFASDWWIMADEALQLHLIDEVKNLDDYPVPATP